MGEILTLPVPETLHGVYAVAVDGPLPDPVELAREHVTRDVGQPLRDLTLRMLDSPLLTLDLRPAGRFPPLPTDMLATMGAAESDLAAIGRAGHILAVRSAYQPGWPPAHEWAARAAAGALGAARSAPVIDVFTPRVLAQDELRRSLPGADGRIRLVDWMLIPHSRDGAGFWFATKGLGRFGLPELRAEDVPPHRVEHWGRLLNGLARRLLDMWLEELRSAEAPLSVELPELVTVRRQDVAAAHEPDPEPPGPPPEPPGQSPEPRGPAAGVHGPAAAARGPAPAARGLAPGEHGLAAAAHGLASAAHGAAPAAHGVARGEHGPAPGARGGGGGLGVADGWRDVTVRLRYDAPADSGPLLTVLPDRRS